VWCRKPRQQDDEDDEENAAAGWSTTVSVSLKHYLGYPNPISGKDRTEAWVLVVVVVNSCQWLLTRVFALLQIPDRMLLQYFAPSFIAAVQAGAQNVMINRYLPPHPPTTTPQEGMRGSSQRSRRDC
jgi:hypothetical protein